MKIRKHKKNPPINKLAHNPLNVSNKNVVLIECCAVWCFAVLCLRLARGYFFYSVGQPLSHISFHLSIQTVHIHIVKANPSICCCSFSCSPTIHLKRRNFISLETNKVRNRPSKFRTVRLTILTRQPNLGQTALKRSSSKRVHVKTRKSGIE